MSRLSWQSKDLFILVAIILAAIPVAIVAQVNFLTSTLLFFGIPSAYLIWRRPRNFKKALVASVVLGLVLGFSFDFIAELNKAWGWTVNFALPVQFFGTVSLDILVWYFFWVFLVVAYYEYFIEHDHSTKISPRAKWTFLIGLLIAAAVVLIWKFAPGLLVLDHAYAKLGVITLIICALLFLKNPHLIPKILHVLPFFIFMYLSYEITALHLGLWTFPGAYFGTVQVENITFPIEELLIWIIASSSVVATYYEFCIDDGK